MGPDLCPQTSAGGGTARQGSLAEGPTCTAGRDGTWGPEEVTGTDGDDDRVRGTGPDGVHVPTCCLALVTGSEDGTLRRVLIDGTALEPSRGVSEEPHPRRAAFKDHGEVRMHPDQATCTAGEIRTPDVEQREDSGSARGSREKGEECGGVRSAGEHAGARQGSTWDEAVQLLYGSEQIGEHAAGTVIRAMAVVPLPGKPFPVPSGPPRSLLLLKSLQMLCAGPRGRSVRHQCDYVSRISVIMCPASV